MPVASDRHYDFARSIIDDFAARTNLLTEDPSVRYLWTDAFAVFAMIALARSADAPSYLDMAKRLVDDVHRTLGRHRDDDERSGWISGLSETEGDAHPTRGGLRIGKPLPERAPDEPSDERVEWERDGQYFHYLTKWMHALHRLSFATGEAKYNEWALELSRAAHRAFVTHASDVGHPRIHWKMSIDLSRPLVASTGQLDALDGYVTMSVLRTSDAEAGVPRNGFFDRATNELFGVCGCMSWVKGDALGIGGLLVDATILMQLITLRRIEQPDLLDELLRDTLQCLRVYEKYESTAGPSSDRLAFRELGLSIGMHGCEIMRECLTRAPERFRHYDEISSLVHAIGGFAPLREPIERYWLREYAESSRAWRGHEDINAVMLATSLLPGGYLRLTHPGEVAFETLTPPGTANENGA